MIELFYEDRDIPPLKYFEAISGCNDLSGADLRYNQNSEQITFGGGSPNQQLKVEAALLPMGLTGSFKQTGEFASSQTAGVLMTPGPEWKFRSRLNYRTSDISVSHLTRDKASGVHHSPRLEEHRSQHRNNLDTNIDLPNLLVRHPIFMQYCTSRPVNQDLSLGSEVRLPRKAEQR